MKKKFNVGDRVRAIARYDASIDVSETDDVINIGDTGIITDEDQLCPSIKWDHLEESSCDWAMYATEIELIED